MGKTDFFINQRPVSISFVCPHCGTVIEIPWDELNVPEYWDDDWGAIECPCCGESVELGDYEFN